MPTLEEKLGQFKANSLENKLRAFQTPEEDAETLGALGDSAAKTLINNVLGAPRATGDLLAGASALLQRPFSDQPLGEIFAEEQGKFPASALRMIPAPTVNEIGAGFRSIPSLFPGGESPSEAFQRNLSDIEAGDAAQRAASPTASFVGEVGGDALSIALGRLPFARKIAGAEAGLMNRAPVAFDPKTITLSQEALQAADKLWKSKGVSKLIRGAGRAVETGAEVAILDAIKGDDPFETAGFAAGIQLGSSAVLSQLDKLNKGSLQGRALKLGAAALAFGVTLQVLENVTTLGDPMPEGSLENAFDKVTLMLVAGAAVSPFGRVRSEASPKLADLVSSLPRASILSMLEELADSDDETRAKVGVALSSQDQRVLEAIESGTLVRDIDKLSFSHAPPRLGNGKP